ncbi:Inhibitor of kappa light polypeptide protein enhancer in B-cells kinase [Chamberlinius hualienensis]
MSPTSNFSNNYIWSLNAVLGKGATGYVYQGLHKHNGESVAVKTFIPQSKQRPDLVQMREFDVLQKLDHENIVKLLAIEEEEQTRSRILVMELCNGGSLYTILDDPENTYGLPEEEFLLVLKHTSSGMNYLRTNHIVHRDLKPGNIMRHITKDGRSVYKLTDFGAARELEDDQQFVSLYGTEEYLHPDMYERAVLRKDARKAFSASVDLWSIGVTLYHVSTGSLPFRPFGGRRNCETMYKITTQKASGIISGVQNSNKGPIEWSDQLPSTCQLNAGLKKYMTPMLAGLMECNPSLMWTFDKFFTEVTNLMQKIKINVFFVDQCRTFAIYCNPNDTLQSFKLLIKEQTNLALEKQRMFYQQKSFDDVVDYMTLVASYPKTSVEDPIFLVSSSYPLVAYTEPQTILFPSFDPQHTLEQVTVTCKLMCSNGYFIKRVIEQIDLTFKLLKSFTQTINLVVKNQFLKLKAVIDSAEEKSISVTRKTKVLQSRHKTTLLLLDLREKCNPLVVEEKNKMQLLVNSKLESSATIMKQLEIISKRFFTGYKKVVEEEHLWNRWKETASFENDLNSCPAIAVSVIRTLRNSWQYCERSRKARLNSSVLNEPFIMLERVRAEKNQQELSRLYHEKCIFILKQMIKDVGQWLSLSQQTSNQAKALESDLERIVEMLCVHDSSVDEANDTYDDMVQGAIGILDGGSNQIPYSDVHNLLVDKSLLTDTPSKSSQLILKKMKEIQLSHTETLNLLQLNQQMMSKLEEASTAMADSFDKCKI